MRDEDEELGATIANSVSSCCVVDAAEQLAAALVHTTASCMKRCLVGDAEAAVVRFLQVFDGNFQSTSNTKHKLCFKNTLTFIMTDLLVDCVLMLEQNIAQTNCPCCILSNRLLCSAEWVCD